MTIVLRASFGTVLAMDSGVPVIFPIGLEPVGRAVEFYADAEDDSGVQYDVRHVAQFAPQGANAFLLESAQLVDGGGAHLLRFRYYHIDRCRKGDRRIALS